MNVMNKILIYSFKDRKYYFLDYFISMSKNNGVFFKIISDNSFFIVENERKILVYINEIFKIDTEIYAFILSDSPVSLFLGKNDLKNYFCLLSYNKKSLKNIFLNYLFFVLILKFLFIFVRKYSKFVCIWIILFCILFYFNSKNILNENNDYFDSKYINLKKINYGYRIIIDDLLKNK